MSRDLTSSRTWTACSSVKPASRKRSIASSPGSRSLRVSMAKRRSSSSRSLANGLGSPALTMTQSLRHQPGSSAIEESGSRRESWITDCSSGLKASLSLRRAIGATGGRSSMLTRVRDRGSAVVIGHVLSTRALAWVREGPALGLARRSAARCSEVVGDADESLMALELRVAAAQIAVAILDAS